MRCKSALLAIAIAGLIGARAHAQSTPSPELGGEIAAQWCKSCHAISEARAIDVGPPFPTIAKRRSPDYLRGFLANPHSRNWMPPFDHLTPQQIEDLVAYIETFK